MHIQRRGRGWLHLSDARFQDPLLTGDAYRDQRVSYESLLVDSIQSTSHVGGRSGTFCSI